MGTNYIIHEDANFELSIDEMSNLLQFMIHNPSEEDEEPRSSVKFDPKYLVDKAISMIEVATYWVEDEDDLKLYALRKIIKL